MSFSNDLLKALRERNKNKQEDEGTADDSRAALRKALENGLNRPGADRTPTKKGNGGTVAGTPGTQEAPQSFYSRPEFGAETENLYNKVMEQEPVFKRNRTTLENAQSRLDGAKTDLFYWQNQVTTLQANYQKAQTQENKDKYNQAYSQFEAAKTEYSKAYDIYKEAFDVYKPTEDAYNAAAKAYTDYMTGQQDQYNSWKGTIRDAGTIQDDLKAVEEEIKALEVQEREQNNARRQETQDAKPWYEKLGEYLLGVQDTTLPTASLTATAPQSTATSEQMQALLDRKALLQEEADWSEYFKWADFAQNEDFEENSKYIPQERKEQRTLDILLDNYSDEASGWEDPLYEYVNGNKEAGAYISNAGANSYGSDNSIGAFFGRATDSKKESQQMTEQEVAIFNYLYKTQGKEAAHEYYNYLQGDLNYRKREADAQYWTEYAAKDPVGSSVFSVMLSPTKGLSYLGQFADYTADGKIDQNAAYNKFSYIGSDIRGKVTEQVEEKWGGVGSFAYQTGMSMADFLMNTAVSGGNSTLSLAIMGTGAAADTTIAAKNRGLSDGQAFGLGTVAGIVEAATEKIGLDALFGRLNLGKGAGGYILTNILAEGAEEGLSSFANLAADIIISKDQSEWQKSVDAYIADGKSEGEAFGLALLDQMESIGLDVLGGAISGGFVGSSSAAIGSVSQSISRHNLTKNLTKNERAVVDKVYKDRVAEAEKDGKVSQKRKNEIYDQVLEDMEKGYISTDTIEEVLGGDTYKSYRDTVDSEDALTKQEKELSEEFNGLNKMVWQEMTGEQHDRREELRTQLKDLRAKIEDNKKTSSRNQLKTQLSQEVSEMVKSDRLAESYNERGRKGQAFQADVSQYDAKQRATVQAAIDSGVLNNTNRAHEFVDLVAKLSADKGVPFNFADNKKLRESGFALEGVTVNGFVNENGVTVNVNSAKALNSVVGHEITHVLEGTELYDALAQTITEYAKGKGDYDARLENLKKLYEGKEGYTGEDAQAKIEQEVVADLVGDYLFTDKDFVSRLSTENRNVFQKIYDEVKYLCRVATAGSKEARQLEKVKKVFEEAYRAGGKSVNNAQYSLENEGKREYNKRSIYSESETLFLSWENGSAPVGETKKFVRHGKIHYYEKTENGCVELSKAQYFERNGTDGENTYRRAEREIGEAHDHDGSTQRGLSGGFGSDRNSGGNAAVFGQAVREELRHDTAGGTSSATGYGHRNDIKQTEYPTEASEDSGASSVITFSNDYQTIRNFMKDGDVSGDESVELTEEGHPVAKDTASEMQFSLSNEGDTNREYGGGWRVYGKDILLPMPEDIAQLEAQEQSNVSSGNEGMFPVPEDIAQQEAQKQRGGTVSQMESVAQDGYQEQSQEVTDGAQGAVSEEAAAQNTEDGDTPITTVKERLEAKQKALQTELSENQRLREESAANLDAKIAKLQAEYDGKKNKDTKYANNLLRRIESLKRRKASIDADYAKRISDIEAQSKKVTEQIPMDHSRQDNLERKYQRIDRQLAQDKQLLAEEFARRKEELAQTLADKNGYISNRADELYWELRGLKSGVRASDRLGYLLDHGYDWNDLKSALINVKHTPGSRVNLYSDVESTVREALHEEYDSKVHELDEMDSDLQRATEELENEAEKQREAAREEDRRKTRSELYQQKVDEVRAAYSAAGMDLDSVLKNAKDLSTFSTVDNTPQRVMEKALGYKEGQILADLTVNKVAQNETDAIRWLNSVTDRKNGLLKQLSGKYNIKPESDESAAAQMYAEGFYVNEQNEIVQYGDAELAKDFPNAETQRNIKGLAADPRIRQFYDETLDAINESRVRNGYPEIPKLDNYFLHFRAMEDTFSRLGLPFNPNDIKAKDLPTDLNGVTADLKPGQPYFSSAQHRRGKRTSFDLLGGMERYATSAKDQIYHIDDIQILRALRNYIADTYGQANGLDGLDELSEEEQQERIKEVYGSHLSTFAKFLNEEANVLAGKTALIDRGLEGIIGRRGITFLDTVSRQVGSNMVGYNASSSLTNFLPVVQAFAKTNKADFLKAFGQYVLNKTGVARDSFAEDSSVMVRRKGADRFSRTLWQKISDPGYAMMGAVDNAATELIARTKFNEFTRKGMDAQQAHYETDKWVSRLMGDRSLGQMPQLYNSKMLGLITKFQLEVRNQLDSQFYDTIQEAKTSSEFIEDQRTRNAVTAAKVASTFAQLAVAQHLFGVGFEALAGYNPAFDIIETIIKAFGWDDDDDSEDTVLDNLGQGLMSLMEDLPYTSAFTGGRIPISSAFPDIEQLLTGENEYGAEVSRLETLAEAAPYWLMPGGYGQLKKTAQGVGMYAKEMLDQDEFPLPGSYTSGGDLRFPVADDIGGKLQATLFGQWASENAQQYIEEGRSPLSEKQTQEMMDTGMTIQEYWDYRDGLKALDKASESGTAKLSEKADYIDSLDLTVEQKNILINNIAGREDPIDMSDYDQYGSFEEFDYAAKNPEKYAFFQENGITYEDYASADEDGKKAYTWAYEYPEKYEVSKAVCDDVVQYRRYCSEIGDITADKDEDGKAISGSKKNKIAAYINGLDLEYGAKIILYVSEYNNKESRETYGYEIVDYLNSRSDISYSQTETILTELGFKVSADGKVTWD